MVGLGHRMSQSSIFCASLCGWLVFGSGAGRSRVNRSKRVVATAAVLVWWDHESGNRVRRVVDDLAAGGAGSDWPAEAEDVGSQVYCHNYVLFVCWGVCCEA